MIIKFNNKTITDIKFNSLLKNSNLVLLSSYVSTSFLSGKLLILTDEPDISDKLIDKLDLLYEKAKLKPYTLKDTREENIHNSYQIIPKSIARVSNLLEHKIVVHRGERRFIYRDTHTSTEGNGVNTELLNLVVVNFKHEIYSIDKGFRKPMKLQFKDSLLEYDTISQVRAERLNAFLTREVIYVPTMEESVILFTTKRKLLTRKVLDAMYLALKDLKIASKWDNGKSCYSLVDRTCQIRPDCLNIYNHDGIHKLHTFAINSRKEEINNCSNVYYIDLDELIKPYL